MNDTLLGSGRPPDRDRPKSSTAMVGLLLLATVAALYVAKDLLIPVTLAILLNLLLSPTVRYLARRRIPAVLSSAALLITIVTALATAISMFAGPADEWLNDAPSTIRQLRNELFASRSSLSDIQDLAEEVDELTAVDTPQTVQQVVIQGPGIFENFVGGLPTMLTFIGITFVLSFFLLASGDTMLRRITACGRSFKERRRIVSIARQIQSDLSLYLRTVTVINLSLGAIVALLLYWLEVPNPFLWGAVAAVFNFAPYVGALATTSILFLVGLTAFDTLAEAIVVPAAFLVLTILEGQFVTPMVLGKRMSLSAIIVFLSVIFWGWLWGVAGALIAVPIATSAKVVFDHLPGYRHLGKMMRSGRLKPEERLQATPRVVDAKPFTIPSGDG